MSSHLTGRALDDLYFEGGISDVIEAINTHPLAMVALQSAASLQVQAINEVWAGTSHEVNEALFDTYVTNYHKAIAQVPNTAELTQMFQINAGRVASAKTYKQTADLEAIKVMTGADQDEYKRTARQLAAKYNRYQAAEYNTMVHRARIARQFTSFKRTRHIYPNLEWIHTRSAQPREVHLRYVGIILPGEHPFYRENVPGSQYNCKCSLRATNKPATEPPEVTITPAPGLEGNPYYTHTLITDQHPYFDGLPKHIPDVGVLRLPDDMAFIKRNTADGFEYLEHYLVGREQEAGDNRSIAELLLSNGYNDIRLLPRIHAREKALRERYYGVGFHPTKCPDARIGNVLVEFKEVSARNIGHAISDAAQKSSVAVLKVNQFLTDKAIKTIAEGRLKQHSGLQQIVIINSDNQLHVYKR